MEVVKQLEDFHLQHPELAKYQDLCLAWYGIGNFEKAFEYLFKSIEQQEEMISYMINSPVYAALRNDPRYALSKKKMNL